MGLRLFNGFSSSVTIISRKPDASINHILNISAVLSELTSIQKTGREIKVITSPNLCSRWTKHGRSRCTICPMANERDTSVHGFTTCSIKVSTDTGRFV